MNGFNLSKMCFALFLVCAAMAVSSPAQTFSVITNFNVTNGALPEGALVQGLDGNFYGVTKEGGREKCAGGCGTIFKVTPSGTLTTLHEFDTTDGFNPVAGLLLAADGNFYGTTIGDTTSDQVNSFFRLTSDGVFSVISTNFELATPIPLIQDTGNGLFYGLVGGGVSSLTTAGTYTVIHTFCNSSACGGSMNGSGPVAPLLDDVNNGLLYGTSYSGGLEKQGTICANVDVSGCGTVFSMGTGGTIKTLHFFEWTDGAYPTGTLAQDSDGNIYGTTSHGALPNGESTGTVFKITPSGTLTTLHVFCRSANCTDGSFPVAGLIQATDGNFYGTTEIGGTTMVRECDGCGTIFQITPSGTFTVLHSFQVTDGMFPTSPLVQGTDGNLYGVVTGQDGMTANEGVIYKISTGLAPFVKTLPLAAHKGTQIFILGTDLTGATSVTFNGTPAAFTVVSATEITATVPAGGSSGTVQVVTPNGTLSSNVPFRVY